MKRFILLIISLIVISYAHGQSGLYINDVFEGKDISKKDMVETLIKGEQLAQYHLTTFHSVKFTATEQQRDAVEKKFQMDMERNTKNLHSQQNCEMELRNGHLFYAIAEVDTRSWPERRYISYQCSATTAPNKYNITLVYIEGRCDLNKLKKIFKN